MRVDILRVVIFSWELCSSSCVCFIYQCRGDRVWCVLMGWGRFTSCGRCLWRCRIFWVRLLWRQEIWWCRVDLLMKNSIWLIFSFLWLVSRWNYRRWRRCVAFNVWCIVDYLNNDRRTLFDLVVIDFSEIVMLYIFELIHEDEILIHFGFVIDVIFFMIHEVLIGRLGHVVDVDLTEEGMVGCVYWLDFIENVWVCCWYFIAHFYYILIDRFALELGAGLFLLDFWK